MEVLYYRELLQLLVMKTVLLEKFLIYVQMKYLPQMQDNHAVAQETELEKIAMNV